MAFAAVFATGSLAATAQGTEDPFGGLVIDTDFNSGFGYYITEPITCDKGSFIRTNVTTKKQETTITSNETVRMVSPKGNGMESFMLTNRTYKNMTGGHYSGDYTIPKTAYKGVEDILSFEGINLIAGNVTAIGMGAFAKCHDLTSVTFPSTLEQIRRGAFYDCTSLAEVNFHTRGKEPVLYPYAFEGCTSLKSIDLRCIQGPFSDKGMVFVNCPNLQEVILYTENSSVMVLAGRETASLTNITVTGTYPIVPEGYVSGENDPFLPEEYANAVLMVPVMCKSLYLEVEPYNKFEHIDTYFMLGGVDEIETDTPAIPVNIDGRRITLIDHSTTVDVYDISGRKLTSLGTASPEYTFTAAGCYLLNSAAGARKIIVQ